jgi:hypothetical protein
MNGHHGETGAEGKIESTPQAAFVQGGSVGDGSDNPQLIP